MVDFIYATTAPENNRCDVNFQIKNMICDFELESDSFDCIILAISKQIEFNASLKKNHCFGFFSQNLYLCCKCFVFALIPSILFAIRTTEWVLIEWKSIFF